ncbi:MAG: PhzF family phenazine biosynthesis protein [Anaerolineae bacterium]|nr:PhzF family phenazine biosynthesis protein [Anaerolineae bacterium]
MTDRNNTVRAGGRAAAGLRVYLYDAFTDRPFGGNVAGVVLDGSGLSPETRQRIAAELNAPTTGFVVAHRATSPPILVVRYHTPRQEIDLCGHVTIALLTALAAHGRCRVQPEGTAVRLHTLAGELVARLHPGDRGDITVEMEQRFPDFGPPAVQREAVEGILGGVALHPSLPLEIVSTGLRHLMVPFAAVEDLARLDPDLRALARLSRCLPVDTVCAFAVSALPGGQVRMRDFCPGIGADEEPASGTTSGALACYLVKHRAVSPDQAGQVRVLVSQGVEMGRPSRIDVLLEVSDGAVRRVRVRGQAVCTLRGRLRAGGAESRAEVFDRGGQDGQVAGAIARGSQ